MHVFHINDYPADPPRASIQDAHRVFPGDGVCPLEEIIAMLLSGGFQGFFSLELFNPEYWKRDALEVAVKGLAKSKAVVEAAVGQVAVAGPGPVGVLDQVCRDVLHRRMIEPDLKYPTYIHSEYGIGYRFVGKDLN